MTNERKEELQRQCLEFRNELIDLLHSIQTGHPGGSLSCTEILTALYFEIMNVDPANPCMEGRDHLILSKGHAAPMLYLALAKKGYFPEEELKNLRQIDSMLQGHPCVHKTPGVELSTGPLGLGLSAGLGMALADRIKGYDAYTYVIMGDGEIQEGCIWEAAMSASKFQADHLIGILDNNGVQLDGTNEEIMPMGDIRAKWESFGWDVITCDGHDVEDICNAVAEAKKIKGKPVLIQAMTVKGKGVSFMEGKNTWHGKAISDEDYGKAKAELGGVKE
ncbi:MAG: transketolase [Clostridium sp.]|nr:transketolase [Clostridium sp.]